ncbi:MAG: hypothetical protein WBV74_20220 [Pseudonocardiaceae bacterium]
MPVGQVLRQVAVGDDHPMSSPSSRQGAPRHLTDGPGTGRTRMTVMGPGPDWGRAPDSLTTG